MCIIIQNERGIRASFLSCGINFSFPGWYRFTTPSDALLLSKCFTLRLNLLTLLMLMSKAVYIQGQDPFTSTRPGLHSIYLKWWVEIHPSWRKVSDQRKQHCLSLVYKDVAVLLLVNIKCVALVVTLSSMFFFFFFFSSVSTLEFYAM